MSPALRRLADALELLLCWNACYTMCCWAGRRTFLRGRPLRRRCSAPASLPDAPSPAVPCPLPQLIEVNRKLLNGTVEIPPEGERSPSPPPIYDVMGMRCAAAAAAWRRLLLHRWPPPLPPPCRAPNCDYARAQLDATP
jgi:hypothetical protein